MSDYNAARAIQSERTAFPKLASSGSKINARDHVASGTGLWVTIAYGLFALVIAASLGVLLLTLPIAWIVDRFLGKRTMARIRGSSVELGPAQLPEVHECLKTYSDRLGLRETPRLFAIESGELNAFAIRVGARSSVVLFDDLIWGSVEGGHENGLQFVLAHELAHHALGHTSFLRSYLRNIVPPLSRVDELSCDAVALQLVGTREAAYDGLMLLTAGPQLLKYLNKSELLRQADEVGADKNSKKAEKASTHPLLLRRLSVLRTAALARS